MSARDDAISIMQQHRPMNTIPGECLCGWSDGTGREIAALGHVIDAIEPIIRADERKKHPGIFDVISGSCGHTWLRSDAGVPGGCPICFDADCKVKAEEQRIRADERKRLREQVRALPTHGSLPVCGDGPVVFLDAVLALLGGESDG